MAHENQVNFCNSLKKKQPSFFFKKDVLDVGSLDINGNNRHLFEDCNYIGVDLAEGNNVDIIGQIHKVAKLLKKQDVIISTEMLEHDKYYVLSLLSMVDLLKENGLLIITCATEGRPEHGTFKRSRKQSPFTNDYYRNITESDIRRVLGIDEIFKEYEFSVNKQTNDLYFWGIKR